MIGDPGTHHRGRRSGDAAGQQERPRPLLPHRWVVRQMPGRLRRPIQRDFQELRLGQRQLPALQPNLRLIWSLVGKGK